MNTRRIHRALLLTAGCVLASVPAFAAVHVQCPTLPGGSYSDKNGDGIIRAEDGEITRPVNPREVCMHLGAGDGFVSMTDGHPQYIFSFNNLTGVSEDKAMGEGMLAANFPAPTITLDEGDHFYLSLTNVGMMMRPDLFDPHTVHWHGFPEASSVFDGVPDASIAINMGSTLTYYYLVQIPGTYMYHCHVEATEHMQMGMLGNLYVRPAQNRLPAQTFPNGWVHVPWDDKKQTGNRYAYNDGDGSTAYDVEIPIQFASFDSDFHDQHLAVQPLPFYYMEDNYPMFNGRGYPNTIVPGFLPAPVDTDGVTLLNATAAHPGGYQSQRRSSLVTVAPGQRILLRFSSLSVTRHYSVGITGVQMEVVGDSARLLRGPDPDGPGPVLGKNLYFKTSSITLGGGESLDAIVEVPATASVGTTYFLYATNLNYLSNDQEDLGGMMTEIRVQ